MFFSQCTFVKGQITNNSSFNSLFFNSRSKKELVRQKMVYCTLNRHRPNRHVNTTDYDSMMF